MRNRLRLSLKSKPNFMKFVLLILFGIITATLHAEDMVILAERLKTDLVSQAANAPHRLKNVPASLSSMNADGSWSDIDYASSVVASWPAFNHLRKLYDMAGAYQVRTNPYYQDPILLSKIVTGLNFWYQKNPRSDNWWFGDIGKQLLLGPICILLKSELPPHLVEKILEDLRIPRPGFGDGGQNLVWHCQKFIWAGAISGNEAEVILGAQTMSAKLLCVAGGRGDMRAHEGIKQDMSFWQHGQMLATLSYGLGAFKDLSFWAEKFNGLAYAFSEAQVEVLASYALNGVQWSVHNGYAELSGIGRSITRPDNTYLADDLIPACDRMMIVDPARADAYKNFRLNLEGKLRGNANGNRHYWISDLNVHRRSGYMVGLKIASLRTKIPESVNGENLHGFYQGVGAMTLLVHGNEYHDIFPVWDWGLYPGTTTRHLTPDEPGSRRGKTAFAGGASDGTYGAVGYDMNWDEVSGKKAWFFFDDEFVALGADIASGAAEEICTTLNQCHRNGPVFVEYGSGAGATANEGMAALENPKWVYHDRVGYIFPDKGAVTLKMADQTGSWRRISSRLADDLLTKAVFSLYLNHGVKPSGASYQYIVMPDSTPSGIQAFVASDPISIVRNTVSIQAVYHKALKRGGAVFYQEGSVVLRPGLSVTVDSPCILLLDESDAQAIKLTASNPKNEALVLTVETVIDGTERRTVLVLPEGEYAGSSVTQTIGVIPTP
jgi:chondroitin AC lyase